jgi:RNA polymerase sigma-70 factor (ECF subfamily)
MPDPGPLPDELIEHHDIQQMLQKTIQELPPKFRSVVVLRYAAQLSFSEIGHALNMPEATAKTYFHRAKVLLRKMLSGQMQPVTV